MLSVKTYRKRQPLLVLLGIVLLLVAFVRGITDVQVEHMSSFEESTISVSMIDSDMTDDYALFNDDASLYLQDMGIDTPLYLQTNERWAYDNYGFDGDQTIAENGCAIASIAMVASAITGYEVLPTEVLDWAGDSYYSAGQGTDWRIFSDYANAFGYQYQDLGTDIDLVADYLSDDQPVIVSVSAGEFTETGHIMVLAGMREDQVIVLDPNDSPEKQHYDSYYTLDDIAMQSVRFWALSNTSI
ncbi:hypothetical protein A5886_002498 [Enterococcus sp. 8G7_MSG3316]|uniref:Peptidase C39 domain-containing protein n=1 Tax=Candidatus Enterococcus testudinis TaxID=1834191 RepID=A0A242A8N8_9ENTE|nr:C39 family peptidase [Enterococcus sp. 8G7_MSG3316]OTN77398.1 hypothetical protein A5886_002498 [Enterococcus sp. 8G7_MSG3316]